MAEVVDVPAGSKGGALTTSSWWPCSLKPPPGNSTNAGSGAGDTPSLGNLHEVLPGASLAVAGCAPGWHVPFLHQVHHNVLHCTIPPPHRRRAGAGAGAPPGVNNGHQRKAAWPCHAEQLGAAPAHGHTHTWAVFRAHQLCPLAQQSWRAPGRWSASVNCPLRSARLSSVALLSSLHRERAR